MPRREWSCASILAVLAVGCASTGATSAPDGRSLTRGKPTSTYEVREAAEPADTDGLEINLQHGVISQEAAQDAVARQLPELTRCYQRAADAVAFAGGPVRLRFLVDASGTTSDVRVTESSLGSYEVERCLIDVGRAVSFPRPRGNAVATIDYSLEFRSTGAVTVLELGPEVLDAQLPALYTRLASCARLGAEQAAATLYVDAFGNVRSAGLASEEAMDADAAACVTSTLRHSTIRLDVIQGGVGRVTVPLRSVDLVARREPSPEVRRYSRASATARARRRPGR